MKLTGKQWWVNKAAVDEIDIKDAIIRNNEKEIVIDYERLSRKEQIKLSSEDGVNFKGEYGTNRKKIGDCEFTLYKNAEGYLLFGKSKSVEEGSGSGCIELKEITQDA